jgi:hypothetical protein
MTKASCPRLQLNGTDLQTSCQMRNKRHRFLATHSSRILLLRMLSPQGARSKKPQ